MNFKLVLVFFAIVIFFFEIKIAPTIPYVNLFPTLYTSAGVLGVLVLIVLLYKKNVLSISIKTFHQFKKLFISSKSLLQKRISKGIPIKWQFALLIIIFITHYHQIIDLYFQSDEWYFFRTYLESLRSMWWPFNGLVYGFYYPQKFGFHLSPILDFIYVLTFRIFGINQYLYLILYAIVHVINSFLLYTFVFQLSKNKKLSFISSLFFLLSVNHHQAYTWISAAPGTTLSVTFMILTLIYFFRFITTKKTKDIYLTSLFTLLALFIKETSLILIPALIIFYFLFYKRSVKSIIQDFKFIWIIVGVFIGMRIITTASEDVTQHKIVVIQDFIANVASVPIWDSITDLFYRYVTFTLKIFSQTYIPADRFLAFNGWFTEKQFPFFNQEAAVRGTTYLMFIQGAAYEFVAYIASLLMFIGISLLRPDKKLFTISFVLILSGVLPIVGITYMFPWWKYSSIIDSRHIYHIAIGGSIIFGLVAIRLSELIFSKNQFRRNVLLTFIIVTWVYWQFFMIRQDLHNLLLDAKQRKIIIKTLQEKIPEPPKKMIIYTTSNKSYYGFGYWMLPFQTAFSHMLPELFGKPYNPNGHIYPQSFYGPTYLTTGGLVSQGYFEDDGYGIGYYLDEIALIKALEKYNYSADMVYAFDYDGDAYILKDKTTEFRQRINEKLEDRKQFKQWKRISNMSQRLSFQVDPNWVVQVVDSSYVISSQEGLILELEVFENKHLEQFSSFVSRQEIYGSEIGTDYLTDYIKNDLDSNHLVYTPNLDTNTIFTVAGNNLMFYKITIYDETKARQFMRTMEFKDDDSDEINL